MEGRAAMKRRIFVRDLCRGSNSSPRYLAGFKEFPNRFEAQLAVQDLKNKRREERGIVYDGFIILSTAEANKE